MLAGGSSGQRRPAVAMFGARCRVGRRSAAEMCCDRGRAQVPNARGCILSRVILRLVCEAESSSADGQAFVTA